MSFSYRVRRELCRVPMRKPCCCLAEAYGVLLYGNQFQSSGVRIITGNKSFAQRLPALFRRAFHLDFDSLPEAEQPGKMVFRVTDRAKTRRIADTLGCAPRQNPALHINYALLEEECCKAAFLRGAFCAGGSITDPAKHYHLELATPHVQVGRELEVLLRDLGLSPKNLRRSGTFTTYFKQSDQIEDFLTLIGAPVSAMEVMNAKAEKDLRNSVNRRLNCDTANLDKVVEASREQAEAIRRLSAARKLEQLPDKLQVTAALRLEYPELTLSELAGEFDPPVTKSCLNHRLRKLVELASALPDGTPST